jgi:hypothetical protein
VFEAVTLTRSVEPRSASTTAYVVDSMPSMGAQAAPEKLQRSHWYAKVMGVLPLHAPAEAVRLLPTRAVPATDGGTLLLGGVDVSLGGVEGVCAEPPEPAAGASATS